jgi:predicted nucleic acid-binding protein
VIVLDASVLIAHFYAKDAHHERADRLLDEVADHELAASPLTLAEVLVGPIKIGRLDQARVALRKLGVRSVALHGDAYLGLAELRAMTNLRLPDCCVLFAAEQEEAELATFDDRLGSVAGSRGVVVLGLS